MRLKDKVAIVTGGAQGIGEGIALRMAEAGAKVGILDLNAEGATKVAEKIKSTGGEAVAKRVDVAKYEATKKAIDEMYQQYGSIDILVNNAGVVGVPKFFVDTDESFWDKIIGVDYKSFLICSHICAKYMVKQKSGKIISLASDTCREGNLGISVSIYAGVKNAVVATSRVLARELAEYRINVNVISPGPIDTPMIRDAVQSKEGKEMIDNAIKAIPLRRLGQPSEIGDLAVFFASEDSKYITGQVLSINGGLIMIG